MPCKKALSEVLKRDIGLEAFCPSNADILPEFQNASDFGTLPVANSELPPEIRTLT